METTARRYGWHDAAGQRHAISLVTYPLPPRPGEEISTLCGLEPTLTRADFPRLPEYLPHKATCLDCDAVWREHEHIAPRP